MTRRIPLAASVTRDAFHDAAFARDWRLRSVVDPDESRPYEEVWTVGDERTAAHYIEDHLIDVAYVLVMGEAIEGVAAALAEDLDVVDPARAAREATSARGKADLMRAIAYLAAASPPTADDDVAAAFRRLLADPDPDVRARAVFASAYPSWPELDPVLEDVRDHDPHPGVRAAAEHALAAIRRHRNGGST